MSTIERFRKWLVNARVITPTVPISRDERAFLDAIFVPMHYARQAGIPDGMPVETIRHHFFRHGLRLDLSPTPLFDRQTFVAAAGDPPADAVGIPTLLRWLRFHAHTPGDPAATPTRLFDADFYLSSYPDVMRAGVAPFWHYLTSGLAEGRCPNGVFDAGWYEMVRDRSPGEQDLPGYLHFLLYGLGRGTPPSAELLPVLHYSPSTLGAPIESYLSLMDIVTKLQSRFGRSDSELVLLMFNPAFYDGNQELSPQTNGLRRLEHFVDKGLTKGISPGPMFDGEYYAERAGIDEVPVARRLEHFLANGKANRISPTPLFDDQVYRQAWTDIDHLDVWAFNHFLRHGLFEGRRVDGSERIGAWSLPTDSARAIIHNWQLFWKEAGYQLPEPVVAKASVSSASDARVVKDIADRDLPLVRAMFVPDTYAQLAGINPETPFEELFTHYIAEGRLFDLAPGPLFDPARARVLTNAPEQIPALDAWLKHRKSVWDAPTDCFDRDFYEGFYTEFRGTQIDLYEHFLIHGLREGRRPNALFDPVWFAAIYPAPAEEAHLPIYLRYLLHGANCGLTPSQVMLPIFGMHGADGQPDLEAFVSLLRALKPWQAELGEDRLLALLAMFVPQCHGPADAGGIRRLKAYLEKGMSEGSAPSPLFDPAVWTKQSGTKFGRGESSALVSYLRDGWPKRVVPTTAFTEQAYLKVNGDVRDHGVWGFRHFLNHGIYEGRGVNEGARLSIAPRSSDPAAAQLDSWRLFWAGQGVSTPLELGVPAEIGRQQMRVAEFTSTALFKEITRRALELDPSLEEPHNVMGYYAAPHHDVSQDLFRQLNLRIPDKTYSTIVTVPWLRTGGADLVACQLANAVKNVFPDENVLILRVDEPNIERPDWVPEGVDCVHISDIIKRTDQANAEILLYALLLALEPKRLINVNSNAIWRVLARFGKRLRERLELYSYLFCWDQTATGLRVGYPSMFYTATAANLSAIMTDTDYLRNELLRIYRPPEVVADRLLPIYTPSRAKPAAVPMVKVAADRTEQRRPRVLWAGRLDRQKRFDLVQKIAARMPHVDFLCWGSALLDNPPDASLTPPNLTLHPSFKSYDELPFDNAELWLFTSAWEGMPTILIEIAFRGMSVVASAVGGVPELIEEQTGYPVADADDVDSYVRRIAEALTDSAERVRRATKLQNLATQRYSQAEYEGALSALFAKEAPRD